MPNSVITILSPHQDDAVFSLAEGVRRLVAGGARVRVANCFTRTEHAPYRAPGDGRAAPVVRAAEDRAAARALGVAAVCDLGFVDAPRRLGVGLDAVCDPALPVDPRLAATLAARVARLLAATGGRLLAPLAPAGAHVDHRVARRAAALLAARAPARVAWYEDLPYAARVPPAASEAAARALGAALGTAMRPLAWSPADGGRAKRAAAAWYASQLAPGDLDLLDAGGAGRGYAERVWAPAGGVGAWRRAWGIGRAGTA